MPYVNDSELNLEDSIRWSFTDERLDEILKLINIEKKRRAKANSRVVKIIGGCKDLKIIQD